MPKERSPQKIVKNLKALQAELRRAFIPYGSVPLVNKIDECIYGEHTEGSLFMSGDGTLHLQRVKERSPKKIVKNLKALRTELQLYHRQNWLMKRTVEKIYECIHGEYTLTEKQDVTNA